MLWETLSAARDLGRLHEIASVLIRWGFGDVVRRLGLGRALEQAGRALHWKDAHSLVDLEPPERVARALEDLGPTFIKLGQMLSTRVDLFPPDWIAAFEKLQDEVPPMDFEALREQLTEDLGQPPEEVFAEIEHRALAAASIAQVHKARLEDGSQVVLKVRRPGITKVVEADLRLLSRLAEIAENNAPELRRYRPSEVVRQFSLSLRRELDLEGEGRHAERIARALENEPDVVIPRIYWQWTCERLNVQQFIEGISGRRLVRERPEGYDLKQVARRGSRIVLQMVLVEGFFHADPHLGNFIVLPGNRLAMVDFGMVGRLSDSRREEIIDLLYGLLKKDSARVLEVLLDWAHDGKLDEDALQLDIEQFLDHYHGLSLKQLKFTSLLIALTGILREYRLILPPDLALLFKTLLTLDGVGRRLDPDFNIVKEATPFMERLIRARYMPDALLKRGGSNLQSLLALFGALPKEAHGLLKTVRRNGVQVHVDLTRLDHFGQQLDRAISRLTIGIIIAALIVGTAIINGGQDGARVLGLPVWGFIGFVFAALGGLWLLVSIWRSGRNG